MNDWHEAEERVERAQQLSESRQWDEALSEIDAAIAINPHNGGWRAQRGFILDQLERFEDATEAYKAALELDPDDAEVALALGINLTRTGRCAEAIETLDDLARMLPDLEPAYCYRIQAHAELGQHDKAEEMFYLAQQLKEDCPHCFYHIGGSLMARGMCDKAVYCWMRTLNAEPAYPSVKQCIASAYRQKGELDRAREYYLAELRDDPGDVDLLFDMAELELEAANPERAAAKLRQITELDPEDAQAHFTLGEVLLEMDQAASARDSFETAAKHDPRMLRLHLRTGQALLMLSRFDEARAHLCEAVDEAPDEPATLMAWGNCLLRLKHVGQAAEQFRRVLTLDEGSADAHHNLGICCFVQGKYSAGLSHELRAVELDPDHLPAMRKAVVALIHLGRWPEVRVLIDCVLELDPDDSALRRLRSRLWRYRLRAVVQGWTRKVRSLLRRVRK